MSEISSNDAKPWSVGANSKRCPMLSVSLDDEDSLIQWDVLIEARRGEEGFAAMGAVRTNACGKGPHNRVIVQAVCVGAIEWQVTCAPVKATVSPPGADIRAELGLAVEECCPGTPGVFVTTYASLLGPPS